MGVAGRHRLGGKVAFMALLTAVFSCGFVAPSEKDEPGLPFADDFSSQACHWQTATDPFVSLGCVHGEFRVLIKRLGVPQNVRRFVANGVPSLRVEADTTRRAGTQIVLYGTSCWSSQEKGYILGVSAGGAWAIFRIDVNANPIQTSLAESPSTNAVPGFAKTNRVRCDCISGAGKQTTLILYVNGAKIATARDRHGLGPLKGYGFFVITTKAGSDVRFDNFAARTISKP